MNIGLCTLSNKDAAVETVLDAAADAGYDGVEIWGKEGHVADGSASVCRDIRIGAAERSLAIPVYGSYLRAGTSDFETQLEPQLAVARRLGADLVRVWAGDRGYEDRDAEYFERVVDDLATAARLAAEEDLALTVEKHANTLTDTAEGARRIVDAVDQENCRLNWQPDFSTSAPDLLAEARTLAPLSNNVHMQAVPECGAPSSERGALRDAFFDVEAILATFSRAGFDGYVNVEFVGSDVPYRKAIGDDLGYLRSALPDASLGNA